MDPLELLKKLKDLLVLNVQMVDELANLISTYQNYSQGMHASVNAPFEFTDTPGTYVQPSLPTAAELTQKLDALSLAGKVDNPNSKEDGE
jgi:hypothetical protein